MFNKYLLLSIVIIISQCLVSSDEFDITDRIRIKNVLVVTTEDLAIARREVQLATLYTKRLATSEDDRKEIEQKIFRVKLEMFAQETECTIDEIKK